MDVLADARNLPFRDESFGHVYSYHVLARAHGDLSRKRAKLKIQKVMMIIRKHVVFVKNHYPVENDPRLCKLFKMLEGTGCFITYIGWDMGAATFVPKEQQIKYKNHRDIVLRARAPATNTVKYLLFLPIWWFFVLRSLLSLKWDIVHVVNFSSVIPAIIASKLKRGAVVYDVEDTFGDQMRRRLPYILTLPFIIVERLSMKFVDAVILVDECQAEEFRGIPNSNVAVIYDSPAPLSSFVNASEKEKGPFTIFYAGGLYKDRRLNLEAMIEAVSTIENVRVIFAGEGDLVKELITAELKTNGKVQYIGYIPYNKVLEMTYKSDLLFSLRDPFPLVQKYICGSKFLEATMCGKPILVNKGTSTAIKVKEAGCGLVVDAHNVEELRGAILKLMHDKTLLTTLSINSKKAYDQKYSWEIMKQKLLRLYSTILR
ncbi:MAG: glycosyltransferase [Fervidobacterium sp.]